MKKATIVKRVLASILIVLLFMGNQSFVNAAGAIHESMPVQQVEAQSEADITESEFYDEETGLKMQSLILEDENVSEEYTFDAKKHEALGNKSAAVTGDSDTGLFSVEAYSDDYVIGNDYIEFAVDPETGRYTIGTVEGNSNYTSDNNQILTYGHPGSGTSYTTVQINGANYVFQAEQTNYDDVNKKAVSVMNVAGVKVMQTLEIVNGDSSNLKDTVRIHYSAVNTSSSAKNVGIRIMIDTMLGSNDGAPFKVPAAGNITMEREFTGNQVPAYWQAFDNLNSPSVFAVGTINKNNQMRKPDKVQYTAWGDIYDTYWDYKISSNITVTNDSAVAFYWNPIRVPAGGSTSVETYYGTSLSGSEGQNTKPVEIDYEDKYVVLVTGNGTNEVLEGAKVVIDGVGTAYTDENGVAVFEKNLPTKGYPSRKKITVSCDGYRIKEVYRLIEKSSCSAVIMVEDDGKPYVKSISMTGTNSGSFADYTDLTSQNYRVEEDSKDEDTYYNILITATGNGNGNVNRYKFIQDNKVIAQETVTTDSRTIRLLKKDLKAGYRVYVQVETDQGKSSSKEQTTLLVNKAIDILGEDTKDTKGSIKVAGSGVKLKIPDDAVAFGGLELNMDMPGLPIEFEAFDDGTVKVAVGLDELGDSWEDKEKAWDDLIAKYEKGDDLHSTFNKYKGKTSWKVAGGFKPSFVGMGYAEGKIDDFGNCNVDLVLILGLKGEYTYSQQYIVGYVPLGFEFKTGVKGTYTAGGTVTVGKTSTEQLAIDFQGKKGKLDIDIYASLYGGLGLVGVLTVGGEGEAHLLLGYDIEEQYYDAKVKGSLALTARAFMFSAKYTIAERTWNIKSGYITDGGSNSTKSMYDVLYDAGSYSMSARDYLYSEPVRQYAAANTEHFFQNVYPASEPQMVLSGGTPYLFWIADDIFRDEANRTCLVYSKYENGWSEPVAVEDDATADFKFDVVANGNEIHVVWQDMACVFGGASWAAMADEDRLSAMSANCDISYARINTNDNRINVSDIVKNNGQADMLPQICVQDGDVSVLWYTNTENDILTQKGVNVISLCENIGVESQNLVVIPEETEVSEQETEEFVEETTDSEAETEESEESEIIEETTEVETEEETSELEEETTEEENTIEDESTEEETEITEESEISTEDNSGVVSETATYAAKAENVIEYWATTVSGNDTTEEVLPENSKAEDSVSENETEIVETVEPVEEESTEETSEEVVVTSDYEINSYASDIMQTKIAEFADAPIVSIALGTLNNKLTVAYVLDDDKDLSTVTDHNLYVYDVDSQTVLYKTTDEVCDSNPQFAPDGSGLYWYADRQLHYITQNAQNSTKNTISFENQAISSENYLVLEDGSIVWTASSVSEEEEIFYEIYRSERVSGIYCEPYKIVDSQSDVIGDFAATTNGAAVYLAYQLNYMQYDVSDIVFKQINAVTDLTLDSIEIDYTSVQPGVATDFVASVTNTGSTDIRQVVVKVYNSYTGEQTSITKSVNIPRGQSVDLELSHLFFVEDVGELQRYLFTVSASGETDERLGDNSKDVRVGYTDISLTSSTYYAADSYYTNLVIQNNTGVSAENTVLRVYADEQEGAILYEEYLGTLEAYKTLALQLDLFALAGNSDVEEIHMVLSTDTEDYVSGNNEEIEYLHFLWREEETYPLTLRVMKGEELYREEVIGTYRAGDVVEIEAETLQGYDFIGWTMEGDGYLYDTANELTYFTMAEEEAVILANYTPNAFKELERTILVGESLLITPVYDGVWQSSDRYGYTKAVYDERTVKVTGVNEGTVQYRYTGNNGETTQIITIHVCSLSNIYVVSGYMWGDTLKIYPGIVEDLVVRGIRQDGSEIELTNVTWSVKNSKIASVEGGVITGKTKGKTVLEGRIGTCTVSIPVEVYIPVVDISVTSSAGTGYVPIGSSVKLKASVYGYNGMKPSNSKVHWYSSNPSVATVDSSGKVTGKSIGNVYIYAEAKDGTYVYGSYYLSVTRKVREIRKSSNYGWLYGYAGGSASIADKFTVYDTNGNVISDSAVQWKSSNSKIASVSYGSTIYMRKAGTVTLTGTYGGKTLKVKLQVQEYVKDIKISGKSQLSVGQSTKLTAKPTNSSAYNKKINFSITSAYDMNGNSVSTSSIATITSSGTLKAYGNGYVYVRAKAADDRGVSVTKKIVISPAVQSVVWSDELPATVEMQPGDELYISAKAINKDGDTMPVDLSFVSNSKAVGLTVKTSGGYNWIYAIKPGTAKITVSYGGKKVTRTIKVIQPVESMDITGDNSIIIGETKTYKAAILPSTASSKKVDWIITKAYDEKGNIVEPTSIVTFNNGKLKALAEGKVVLRASALDGSGTYALKTVEVMAPANALSLSQKDLKLNVGDTVEITAELSGDTNLQKNSRYIKWSSSNAKVVSADNGSLQAHKKGSVTITATYGKKKATLKVKVVQPTDQMTIVGNDAMTVGKTLTLKASVLPKDVSNKNVTWEIAEAWDMLGNKVTSTSDIATITAKGKITAIKTGTIKVRATALDGSGCRAEQKITIYGKPQNIEITGRSTLVIGEETLLTAVIFDDAGYCIENAQVKWTSSNKKIVSVDTYGRITAVKAGEVTIKATIGNKSAQYKIIVK